MKLFEALKSTNKALKTDTKIKSFEVYLGAGIEIKILYISKIKKALLKLFEAIKSTNEALKTDTKIKLFGKCLRANLDIKAILISRKRKKH